MAVTASEKTVIVIGPAPDGVGGMASVVSQMLALNFSGRYRIEFFPITIAVHPSESIGGRMARHVAHLHRLWTRIGRCRARIAHIHTCSGFSFCRAALDMLVARQRGCRTILHIHGAAFDSFYDAEPLWRKRLIRWTLTHASLVVALSNGWREKLRGMAPKAKIVVVENAVETPPVIRKPERNGTVQFVLLARMDEWKGIDDLLEACVLLHSDGVRFQMTLAGPPGTAGDAITLSEKIRSRNLAGFVRYVGSVQGKEKSALLLGADAYVQASHNEGLPIALLEALSYGLPIVATRVGAVPEFISDRREGLLVPPRRPDLLADAMRQIARDDSRRQDMSRQARSLAAERFGIMRFRDELRAMYDGVLPLLGSRTGD